jgi:hypothetical protein
LGVAKNFNTPPLILAGLAHNGGNLLVAEAVMNPSTPVRALASIWRWQHLAVERPDAPPDMLEQWSTHAEAVVRRAVAAHPSTPPHVLQRLARGHHSIRKVAEANPSFPEGLRSPRT